MVLLCRLFRIGCGYWCLENTAKEISSKVGCSSSVEKTIPSCSSIWVKVDSTKLRGNERSKLKSKSGSILNDQCAYCREFGHCKDCQKLFEKNMKKSLRPSEACVAKTDGIVCDTSDYSLSISPSVCYSDASEWMLDTGSTYHICPRREWFASFEKLDGMVLMGDDHACHLLWICTIGSRCLMG